MARKTTKPGRRRLAFESLEGRRVLAAFNMPWPEPDGISISFLADGTQIGSAQSDLEATLDAVLPRAVWQETILQAFQTWAAASNINLSLSADNGLPVGVLGFKQGDPRFGDIRIGAFPMASDVLAVANPYDAFVANTWVGDVFLNSAAFASMNADASASLLALMLHEAGHTLGIGHSEDPASPMYPRLLSSQVSRLTAADVAALQAQYGPRRVDAWEGAAGNDILATAAALPLIGANGQIQYAEVAADVTNLQDVDVYRVTLPPGVQAVDVRLFAAGVSLLTPRVSVLNAAGAVVATAESLDPTANDLSLLVDQFQPGDVYYVRVESARGDAFGTGAYHLELAAHGLERSIPPNREPRSAEPELLATTPGYVEHTYYEAVTTLDAFQPAVTYRVRSVDLGPDLNNVFTVVVDGYGNPSPLDVQITDDQGQAVAFEVLAHDEHLWQIQVQNVQSYVDYLIRVSGDISQGPVEVEVEVDFAVDGAHQETLVNDSLAANEDQLVRTLLVDQTQQFHFTLAASDYSQPQETGVRMTIANATGQIAFEMSVADGAVRTGDAILDQGAYSVRFTRAAGGREPLFFQLSGAVQSSPIGPLLHDTTLAPVTAPVDAALASLSFYWLPERYADLAAAQSVARDLRTATLLSPVLSALKTPEAMVSSAAAPSGGIVDRRASGAAADSLRSPDVASSLRDLDRITAVSQGKENSEDAEEHSSPSAQKSPRGRRSQDMQGDSRRSEKKTQRKQPAETQGGEAPANPATGNPPVAPPQSSHSPPVDDQSHVPVAPSPQAQSLRARLLSPATALLALVFPFVAQPAQSLSHKTKGLGRVRQSVPNRRLKITRLR